MARWLTVFPLMLIPVLVYLLVALTASGPVGGAISPVLARLDGAVFTMPMLSGASWRFRLGDFIVLLGLLMLSIEIVKSTSTKSTAIANHAASMGVLVFCLVAFLVFGRFATSVFFFLTMMALLDVLAGVMVTIVSARRDFGVGDSFGG